MYPSPKVYIILLNYNGWRDTIECIESLLNLTYQNFQIIVVDNNSPNGSINYLSEWASAHFHSSHNYIILEEDLVFEASRTDQAAVIFIKSSINAGFAAGNNLAIKFAIKRNDFEFLWLLNNDTTVDAESLAEQVKRAVTDLNINSRVGIWGSKILYFHNPNIIQAIGAKFNLTRLTTSHIAENDPDNASFNASSIDQDYVVGASMFVSKDFIKDVGLLCEDYFLYFEELDWATRGTKKGYTLGYVYSSKVYHKEGQTIGSSSKGNSKSELSDYHGIRSKIIFVKKFYPERTLQLYILLIGSVILRLARLKLKRAKNILNLMTNI